ncbi:hypothetical protein [Brumicola nitratireducens]|uniref:YtkA-like domain-containing protein n=1 Tax=Glaciecola nitratireducens (strain JCM 12485 / KCTC 12276 / FR1064) TaxID=1085623 RepID=G4QHF9_GLANF|nr:hypothetical protein [Glaciecola nitratireducens]AEP29945.1 hypothetical protein GNIT_1836 [Glaciecola nitratireducens FR1064]
MYSKQALILFVALLAISLAGVYYKNVNSSGASQDKCDLNLGKCTFVYGDDEISVNFLSPIVTEEEVLLRLELPPNVKLTEAWIEGLNMFMGKTPVIEEAGRYVTFLGSCNLETMHWQLTIKVIDKNGQVNSYSAVFYTSSE